MKSLCGALRRVGGSVHENVGLQASTGMGRGLFASEGPIRLGERVVEMPRKSWLPLSAEKAWGDLSQKHPEFVERLMRFAKLEREQSRAQAMLVGSICFVIHVLREFEKPSSELAAKIVEMIPKEVSGLPLFWQDEDLMRLQTSPLTQKVIRRRKFMETVYNECVGDFAEDLGENITSSNFMFSWSLILTRATSDVSRNLPFCIVPVMDLMNHTTEEAQPGFCDHFFDVESQTFVVTASKDVRIGQELFIRYGERHGNADLLRLYGFTLPKNPWNSIDCTVNAPEGPIHIRCMEDGHITYPEEASSVVDKLTLVSSFPFFFFPSCVYRN